MWTFTGSATKRMYFALEISVLDMRSRYNRSDHFNDYRHVKTSTLNNYEIGCLGLVINQLEFEDDLDGD